MQKGALFALKVTIIVVTWMFFSTIGCFARPQVVKEREDPSLGKKRLTETRRQKAQEIIDQLSGCCDRPSLVIHKRACLQLFPKFHREMEAGTWTYYCGNYDEALRRFAQAFVDAREMLRIVTLAKGAADRCTKSVENSIATLNKWALRLPKLKDQEIKKALEKAIEESVKNLRSLEATCSSTDPGEVVRLIGPQLRNVDLLFRRAR